MNLYKVTATIVAALGLFANAQAAVITLTFEGIGDGAQILDFYNGGTDSTGHTGTNYGVAFGSNTLALIDADVGGNGNFANEPSPSTVMFFLTGTAVLNYAPGFTDAFSFYYSSSTAAAVTVYSGLNRTGSLLGTINLVAQYNADGCTGDPTGTYCNWTPIGVPFAGTARSIDFSGTVNRVAFDNITFGAIVPEPASFALYAVGLVGVACAARKTAKRQLRSQ